MRKLIGKAKMHDKEAFGQLIKLHMPSLYKVAKAIVKNDDDAADAIQETALTCWQKIDTLKNDAYFKTWLTRILINHCNAILRQKSRMVPAETIPEEGRLEDSYSSVEWREFLNCLDEKYRTVVILYYVEGFKIREIAKILDLNENTVSGRLVTARDKMERQYRRSVLRELSQSQAPRQQPLQSCGAQNRLAQSRQPQLWPCAGARCDNGFYGEDHIYRDCQGKERLS